MTDSDPDPAIVADPSSTRVTRGGPHLELRLRRRHPALRLTQLLLRCVLPLAQLRAQVRRQTLQLRALLGVEGWGGVGRVGARCAVAAAESSDARRLTRFSSLSAHSSSRRAAAACVPRSSDSSACARARAASISAAVARAASSASRRIADSCC